MKAAGDMPTNHKPQCPCSPGTIMGVCVRKMLDMIVLTVVGMSSEIGVH